MLINEININNYRIYFGPNKLGFSHIPDKNIFIVSGENGFGKTSFLTSLVWCLYGKLMVDVDEKYRRDIYEAGGYKKYATQNLNRKAATGAKYSYSVSIKFSEVLIPSLPCKEVEVIRTFDTDKQNEVLKILIDGEENELTRNVGPEIFISDFILPKEVAKFFFFDAEKIVSLAEMKSIEEKRSLSKAYAEVLGIKKYLDLKENLQDLRLRLRRGGASAKEKQRFDKLQKDFELLDIKLLDSHHKIDQLIELKAIKRRYSDELQEKLIREGSPLTVDELISLKELRDKLSAVGKDLRAKMSELMDLAPFAIAGTHFIAVREQIHKEIDNTLNTIDPILVREKIENIKNHVAKIALKELNLNPSKSKRFLYELASYIKIEFIPEEDKDFKPLLSFTEEERNGFEAIYSNLKHSYSHVFKLLVQEEKNNRIALNKIFRQISSAESKASDKVVKIIRAEKVEIDNEIVAIELELSGLNQTIGSISTEKATIAKQLAELSQKIDLEKSDKEKDATAARLIDELEQFILNLKIKKKSALEKRIKNELDILMHKVDFVSRVEVEIAEELIDINLFDGLDRPILKESLSKGEQQLYATAILKALVDESNILFPVFIDSPLQKFDKRHSKNVISHFYPSISKQVVLLPLLEKELLEEEYALLRPRVNASYKIKNNDQDSSVIELAATNHLYSNHQHGTVHAH